MVGDENLRGVFGGQKRLVTVRDMLTDPNTRYLCLEQITDGLSSTDSLSLVESLKKGCVQRNISGIVSLQQPSDEIIHLFDKLLVLSENGEQVYFGSIDRDALKAICLEDNRRDSDSICDLVLRSNASESLIKKAMTLHRFQQSAAYKILVSELAETKSLGSLALNRDVNTLLPHKNTRPQVGTRFVFSWPPPAEAYFYS